MNDRAWTIPESIEAECKKYFTPALIQTGLRFFKLSRVSISFKKGTPETYYIVSGIVRDDRTHETKIVYKKRLEDTPEGPLSSNCDCHHWKEHGHCGHVVALFQFQFWCKRSRVRNNSWWTSPTHWRSSGPNIFFIAISPS